MKDLQSLEEAWRALPPAPREGTVKALVVRLGQGRYENPESITISAAEGVIGDRWSSGKRDPRAQVSIMEHRVAELIGEHHWTRVGDNLLVDFDLSEPHLPAGTRLHVGTALLEVTDKPHLGCMKFKARFGGDALSWVNDKATRPRRLRGLHTRVIEGGVVSVGDAIRRI